MTIEEMVEKFQCPGCVCGSNTKCGAYRLHEIKQSCMHHILGTAIESANNLVALGLPKGFNKPGWDGEECRSKINIRFHISEMCKECYQWNHLNVPVWAMEDDGFLFVRTYSPRIDWSCIDIIAGGTLDMVPQAINVTEFYTEID